MPVSKSKQGKPLGGIGAERQSGRRHSLVIDDRLLSKQYITAKLDSRIDNTAYGAGWNGVTDRAPSVDAVYDKINSLGTISDIWGQEDATDSTTDVRFKRTGNFGIGNGTSLAFNDITEKLYVDGNIKSTGDLLIGDDVSLLSDASILNFGGDSDVNLTHVHDTGLLLNSSRQLQFGDSGTYIHQSADGVLDLVADTEIEINATTIDMNGAADISGNLAVGGNTTIAGNLTVTGTATAVLSETVNIQDNMIVLNSNEDGTPSSDAGIEVNRGTSPNRKLYWDETNDVWKIQTGDSSYAQLASGTGTVTGTNTGDVTLSLASGVPSGAATLSSQALTIADKFTYSAADGTNNVMGVTGQDEPNGKLTIHGKTGATGTGTNCLTIIGGSDSGAANAAVSVTGHIEATTKSFNIPHPIDINKRLVYGSLEGPEHGMYARGSFEIEDDRRVVAVDIPNYWSVMVYDDYTVNLTGYGDYNVWISNRDENGFWVETNAEKEWSFDWSVMGGRQDAKLVVEPDA